MKGVWRWLAFAMVCLLSACATKKYTIVPETLSPFVVEGFSVNGRVSIRYSNGADYIRFSWQADQTAKHIQIYTPIGTAFAQIIVSSSEAIFQQGEKKWIADDAEALMDQLVKWHFPISGLNHWILGLAEPNVAALWTRQEEGWRLQQSGWDIYFSDYKWLKEENMKFVVPTHIKLSNSHLTLNMIVSDHRLEGGRAVSFNKD